MIQYRNAQLAGRWTQVGMSMDRAHPVRSQSVPRPVRSFGACESVRVVVISSLARRNGGSYLGHHYKWNTSPPAAQYRKTVSSNGQCPCSMQCHWRTMQDLSAPMPDGLELSSARCRRGQPHPSRTRPVVSARHPKSLSLTS